MTHKEKCKKMKSIRKSIADRLGIDLHQTECTYKGECKGTCPRCAQEEKTLNKALLKNTAAVAGLAMSTIAITSCGSVEDRTTESKINSKEYIENGTSEENGTTTVTTQSFEGDVVVEGMETLDPNCTVTITSEEPISGDIDSTSEPPLEGEPVYDPSTEITTEDYGLDGDIAMIYIEDDTIIEACQNYSRADVCEIINYDSANETATVECRAYLNEINPATDTSRIETIATITVDRTCGEATDDKGNIFSIYDYLGDE